MKHATFEPGWLREEILKAIDEAQVSCMIPQRLKDEWAALRPTVETTDKLR